jgi:hypothetical protein
VGPYSPGMRPSLRWSRRDIRVLLSEGHGFVRMHPPIVPRALGTPPPGAQEERGAETLPPWQERAAASPAGSQSGWSAPGASADMVAFGRRTRRVEI